jgi:hypothetical protein
MCTCMHAYDILHVVHTYERAVVIQPGNNMQYPGLCRCIARPGQVGCVLLPACPRLFLPLCQEIMFTKGDIPTIERPLVRQVPLCPTRRLELPHPEVGVCQACQTCQVNSQHARVCPPLDYPATAPSFQEGARITQQHAISGLGSSGIL